MRLSRRQFPVNRQFFKLSPKLSQQNRMAIFSGFFQVRRIRRNQRSFTLKRNGMIHGVVKRNAAIGHQPAR